jgi:hypothetical protein
MHKRPGATVAAGGETPTTVEAAETPAMSAEKADALRRIAEKESSLAAPASRGIRDSIMGMSRDEKYAVALVAAGVLLLIAVSK